MYIWNRNIDILDIDKLFIFSNMLLNIVMVWLIWIVCIIALWILEELQNMNGKLQVKDKEYGPY